MNKLWFPIIFVWFGSNCYAENLREVVISSPGPGSLTYLPVDLIPFIHADAEEGLQLRIIHTASGVIALRNMLTYNSDFAVAGVPAAMSQQANGGDVVVIAAVSGAPLFVLMVRAELQSQVRQIGDLTGKIIGVNTSTSSSKTSSEQILELLLKSNKVSLDSVRIVPAGQDWMSQSALIMLDKVDAIMGDEPFASRLLAQRQVFFLANLGQPATVSKVPGMNFLHAALETRSDVITNEPHMVKKVVRMIQRSLAWIANHSPQQLVDVFAIKHEEERAALLHVLQTYPNVFSRDGKFIPAQLHETEVLFQSSNANQVYNDKLKVTQMLDTRWLDDMQ
jgi:NitT/TauT family transport system substrate-binding protein